jgi:N-acetylglucosamine-6-sulfatase
VQRAFLAAESRSVSVGVGSVEVMDRVLDEFVLAHGGAAGSEFVGLVVAEEGSDAFECSGSGSVDPGEVASAGECAPGEGTEERRGDDGTVLHVDPEWIASQCEAGVLRLVSFVSTGERVRRSTNICSGRSVGSGTVTARRVRRFPVLCALAGLGAALPTVLSGHASSAAQPKSAARPNVVLVVTDDQRWDSIDQMPQLDSAPGWARFSNAFVDEPQCCPSRASIFTGRYPQNTGVETLRDGADMNEKRTVATMLHKAGYRTGHFGKYLNGYASFGRGLYVPPGWNDFVATVGADDYFDYKMYESDRKGGRTVSYGSAPTDYKTDVLTAMGRKFIRTTKRSQPFFLYLAVNAPHFDSHGRVVGAPEDPTACSGRTFPEPPNFNAYDAVSEPAWMVGEKPVNALKMQIQLLNTCKALQRVDQAVTSVVQELEREGRLKNTYVMFTSDNGYEFGEHRLTGKGDLYEASVRVPLLVRGPDVQPGTIDRLTSNVDFVPTILDWANVASPRHFLDGQSFAADPRGDPPKHEPREVLLRGCRTQRGPKDDCGGYRTNMGFNWGLRTATHKYIEYPDGYVQLFDLTNDPWELTNLGSDPAQAPLIADLHARLSRLRTTEGGR